MFFMATDWVISAITMTDEMLYNSLNSSMISPSIEPCLAAIAGINQDCPVPI